MPDTIDPRATGLDTAPKMQTATAETRVEPAVARGPTLGAAIGGALVLLGSALAAVPFPLPWLGPVLAAVLSAAGTVIAAVNGAQLPPPKQQK